MHSVLHVGAADGRGALGPQRDRTPAAVVERVHLLLDDVGRFADTAREQLGGLERRRLDAAVARCVEERACAGLQGRAPLGLLGQHVEGAARRADLVRQRSACAAGAASSSLRNGFVARSAPSVVISMWPG